MNEHKYPYKWMLKEAKFTRNKGKVFSCFACGGGSSMGYKLAGFDVIGCNEIDPKMNACYVENHHPKYNFICDVREMLKMELPQDLYELDVLDGSPPCSTFSMAGSREDAWGKKKKFREGQKEQVLDTLFFDFIALAKRLQPKVVVAENVKGILLGSAKEYVSKIYDNFDKAGYYCQHFLLDASCMGVPQKRNRVFFLCLRKDLASRFNSQTSLFQSSPYIDMDFREKKITCRECCFTLGKEIKGCFIEDYKRLKNGCKKKYLQSELVDIDSVHPTITAGYSEKAGPMPSWSERWLSMEDLCKIGTFPLDYNFIDCKSQYMIGMSVPPVMMAQVASRVYDYWLSRL